MTPSCSSPRSGAAWTSRSGRTRLAWSIAFVGPELIDRINILQATLLASTLAAARLPVRPDALLLDAVSLPEVRVHQRVLVSADRLCASVAAASVVAKVARDALMEELDVRYPGYEPGRQQGLRRARASRRPRGAGPVPDPPASPSPRAAIASKWRCGRMTARTVEGGELEPEEAEPIADCRRAADGRGGWPTKRPAGTSRTTRRNAWWPTA